MNEAEQAIRRVFDTYQTAVYAKDVDAFVALYDHDVCVFDLWSQWSYSGIDAWRAMAAGWFKSLGTERVIVELAEVQIMAGRDVAFAHAFITYQGVSAEGQKLRAMHNRLTWALQQSDGAWKIVHEHTSAPVDFETAKVILRRA